MDDSDIPKEPEEETRRVSDHVAGRTTDPGCNMDQGLGSARRTPENCGGGGGTVLQFQITTLGNTLTGAAGSINNTLIDETVEEDVAAGLWYLESLIPFTPSTGLIGTPTVQWKANTSTNSTDTLYSYTIGTATISDEDPTVVVNFNYGPILALPHGAVDNKWAITIF